MQTLGGVAIEGGGYGLKRISGSFTTLSNGTPTGIRTTKGNFTVTRNAQGVYTVQYAQPGISVVFADAWLTYASAIVGAGSVSLGTAELGVVNCSGDFMTSDGTHYTADTTNSKFLILVYNAGSNHTSLSLTDVYSLTAGNTSGVANVRVNFEFQVATDSSNY